MQLVVDGIGYTIGANLTGDSIDTTYVEYNTKIDGELVILNDISSVKHHGEDNHPEYTHIEKTELILELKNVLADNIRKIINSSSSDGRS
jgi:hypothetical protein